MEFVVRNGCSWLNDTKENKTDNKQVITSACQGSLLVFRRLRTSRKKDRVVGLISVRPSVRNRRLGFYRTDFFF